MSKNEEILDKDLSSQLDEENKQEEEFSQSKEFELTFYPVDIQLQSYKEQWDDEQFGFPEFQRNYIWDKVKASRFIESFLLGLPVPAIFLYKGKDDPKKLIVDGQQRVISIVSFLEGEFIAGQFKNQKFALEGVNKKWEGLTFKQLDEYDAALLQDSIMRATIIRPARKEDEASIYDIFYRLNTGVAPLNPMEIRMCAGESKFTKLLRELNKLPSWRKLIEKGKERGKGKEDKRLKDIELILRFFALEEDGDKYKKPMKVFLNGYIQKTKKKDTKWVDKKRKLFKEAIDKALSIDENLFKIKNINGKYKFSIPALESILVALANTKVSEKSLKDKYDKLINNQNYIDNVTSGKWTTDVYPTKERINIAKDIFHSA